MTFGNNIEKNEMNDRRDNSQSTPTIHRLMRWAVLAAGIIFGSFFVFGYFRRAKDARMLDTMIEHFPAAIGLPAAALTALFVVVFLESSSGPIKFEGLGFKFEGASGPVVLWAFCFLCISGAIKLLW